MNQFTSQSGYLYTPSSPSPQPTKRKIPIWPVFLLLIVLLVGGIYAFTRSQTDNRPNSHLGETYGNFLTRYGTPQLGTDGVPEFMISSSPNVTLDPAGQSGSILSDQNAEVYIIEIYGPNTWTIPYTTQYCKQFLPIGATFFQPPDVTIAANITLYHSSVGTVYLEIDDGGRCGLSIQTNL